jgi:hypothetical protein
MEQRTLEEKREQMLEFLVNNIIANDVHREGNDVVFTGKGAKKFLIKTLSRQSDFKYDFEEDASKFDEDRRRLLVIKDGLVKLITDINQQGYVPGFVLLRAEADYSQITGERTTRLVNHGHFLKQLLPSEDNPKPRYNLKVLDPIELVMWHLYGSTISNDGKRIISKGDAYTPEVLYFNTKKNTIEVACFADIADAKRFRSQYCPVCEHPNEGYNHSPCKEMPEYIWYRQARERARYQKKLTVSTERTTLDSRTHVKSRKGVEFAPSLVMAGKLGLPQGELYLATVSR